MGHPNQASAARSQINGFCNTDDNTLFPYGYMCGTYPTNYTPMQISVDNVTDGFPVNNGATVHNGSVLSVTISWNGVSGPPKRDATDNDPTHPNAYKTAQPADKGALFFATINAENSPPSDSSKSDQVFPSGASPAGALYEPCPGDGGAGHGKIWGDRDIPDHDYDNNAAVNNNNQSPYAYHQGDSNGVINCQNHGKMVYWRDDAKTTKSYSFNLRLGDELTSDSICIRGNLAIRFGNDIKWFPDSSPANSSAPYIGPGSPLTPAENSRITATHLVKQSDRICFAVDLRPVGRNYRATFLAECNRNTGTGRIYGHVSEYNSGGNYVGRASNVFVSLQELNLGLPVNPDDLGSDTTDGNGDFSINLPFNTNSNVPGQTWNAATVFNPEHVDRSFQLIISRGSPTIPQQPLPDTGQYYRVGANLDCRRHPPIVDATPVCEDGKLNIHAYDPDDLGKNLEMHVWATDSNGNITELTPPSGTNTDDLKNLALDISSLQNGFDYTFDIRAVDNDGDASLNTRILRSMQGCGHFELEPGASGSLQPSDEDPNSFLALNTIRPAYPGWNGTLTKPAVTANAQNSLTKDGNPITGSGFASYTTFISRDYNASYAIPAGSYVAGNEFCTNISITPYSGIIRNDGVIIKEDVHTKSANKCDTVQNEPFFKVYGGSVSAGGNFVGTGSCSTPGVLSGFYRNDSVLPEFKYGQGSSTDLAALSINQVTGFASHQIDPTKSPLELTFANQGVAWPISSDPKLGGLYGGDHCIDNADPPSKTGATTTTLPGGSTIHATTLAYTPTPENKSIFVNGDVYIDGDIKYDGAGGGWTPDKVPSMVVKAIGGNIYISNNVHTLDGLYIAEATSAATNKGQIYTCATGPGAQVAQNSLYDNCYNQLTVHGNFVARKVNLMRTYGSLRDEKPTPGTSAIPAGPDSPGVKNRPVWSPSFVPSGYTAADCVNVDEPAEPASSYWYDNYLCLKAADRASVEVKWDHAGAIPNDSTGKPMICATFGDNPSTNGMLKFLQNLGEPASSTWNDNNLCSNLGTDADPGLVIGTAYNLTEAENQAGGPWLCDQMYENSDVHVPYWTQTNNIKVYICIKKFIAGGGGAAAVLPAANPVSCSNARAGAKSYFPTAGRPNTCAAEVFDFSPEFYLAQPSINPPNGGAIIYDSITSLPPVL